MTVSPTFMEAAQNRQQSSPGVNNMPTFTAEQARRVQARGSLSYILNPVDTAPAADDEVDDQVTSDVDDDTFREAFHNNTLTTYDGATAILSQMDMADMFPEDDLSPEQSEFSLSPTDSRFLRDGTTPRHVTLADIVEVIETTNKLTNDKEIEQSVAELLGLAFLKHPDFGYEDDFDIEDEMEVDSDSGMDVDCDEALDVNDKIDCLESQ